MGLFSYSSVAFDVEEAIDLIQRRSISLEEINNVDLLLEKIGDARIVMLGEASHGTHEFYTWRTYLTKRLIKEKQFNFIAVEGDWPDCYKINRFITGYDQQLAKPTEVLKTFDR